MGKGNLFQSKATMKRETESVVSHNSLFHVSSGNINSWSCEFVKMATTFNSASHIIKIEEWSELPTN